MRRIKDTLVLGMGNTIRGDDGVGILAVRLLREQIGADRGPVEVKEIEEASINILEMMEGYRKLVVVDSIRTDKAKAGSIHRLDRQMASGSKSPYSSHQMGLFSILDMAQDLNMKVPQDVVIYAVEVRNNDSFSCEVAAEVTNSIPELIRQLKKEVSLSN